MSNLPKQINQELIPKQVIKEESIPKSPSKDFFIDDYFNISVPADELKPVLTHQDPSLYRGTPNVAPP